MNQNLKNEMKSIAKKKNEWLIIMPKNYGKPVVKYTSNAPDHISNKYVDNKKIMNNAKNYIYIHSHPIYHIGNIKLIVPFSARDLEMAEADEFAEQYVVNGDLYYKITAKHWGDRPNEYYRDLFRKTYITLRDNWRKKVNDGTMSLTYYCRNLHNEVMKRVCRKLNWNYSVGLLEPSGKNPYDKWNFEVVTPTQLEFDMPWIKKSTRNKYEKRWKQQMEKYPELKKYDDAWKLFYNEETFIFDEDTDGLHPENK